MNDFNNDGKVDWQDHYIYSQLSDDKQTGGSTHGGDTRAVDFILFVVCGSLASSFMKGNLGFGFFSGIIGIVSIIVTIIEIIKIIFD